MTDFHDFILFSLEQCVACDFVGGREMAILIVALISMLCLVFAHRIDAALGRTGTNVVERILGLLVLVIAVQFVFNGVSGYLVQL